MIRYSHITLRSFVDGPGERTVLFAQGCSVGCKGCQNKHLWGMTNGLITTEAQLAELLVQLSPNGNLTLSGGEILDQPDSTLQLLTYLRKLNPNLHIISYSGRTWEQIFLRLGPLASDILELVDILVDGPFVARQDDSLITWRGSRNQRPIDVKASLETGHVVVLDWDNPEIVIDGDGGLHMPIGLAPVFSEAGQFRKSRRCGETQP